MPANCFSCGSREATPPPAPPSWQHIEMLAHFATARKHRGQEERESWLGCVVFGWVITERHRQAEAHDFEEGCKQTKRWDLFCVLPRHEWLRRRPPEPIGSARVGSNPTGVAVALHAGGTNVCPEPRSSNHEPSLRYESSSTSDCHRSHFGSRYKLG